MLLSTVCLTNDVEFTITEASRSDQPHSQNFTQKPWPEPVALAFKNLKPGQSRGQAVTLAWLGLA
jgi:hypothetical protein